MTYLDIINLNSALTAVNASQTVIAEGKPVAVKRRLSWDAQLAIARALAAIKPVLTVFNDAKESIIRSHGGPFAANDSPGIADAQAEISKAILAEANDAPLISFPSLDLFRCDDLPIEADVIAILLPYCAA